MSYTRITDRDKKAKLKKECLDSRLIGKNKVNPLDKERDERKKYSCT